MNDFTIEELKDLYDSCFTGIDNQPDEDIRLMLQDKLQSLIDNYCEHSLHTGAADTLYCDKCEIVLMNRSIK